MVFRQSARSSWTWAGGGATLRLELRRFRRGPDGSAGSDRDRSSSTGSPSLRSSRDALNRFLRCCALRSAMKWFMFRGTLRTTAPRSSIGRRRAPKALERVAHAAARGVHVVAHVRRRRLLAVAAPAPVRRVLDAHLRDLQRLLGRRQRREEARRRRRRQRLRELLLLVVAAEVGVQQRHAVELERHVRHRSGLATANETSPYRGFISASTRFRMYPRQIS